MLHDYPTPIPCSFETAIDRVVRISNLLEAERGNTQLGKVDHTKVLNLELASLLVKNETFSIEKENHRTLQMLLVEESHKPVIMRKWPSVIVVIVVRVSQQMVLL